MPLDVTIKILILLALRAYRDIIFLRIIVSLLQAFAGFSPPEALRPAFNFLYDATEPFLRLFRRLLPSVSLGGMGLDLSPILAFIVLDILSRVVQGIL